MRRSSAQRVRHSINTVLALGGARWPTTKNLPRSTDPQRAVVRPAPESGSMHGQREDS